MHGTNASSVRRALGLAAVALGVMLLALGPLLTAEADAGPKPGMTFVFEFEGDPIEIISGELIECDDSICAAGEPLDSFGPQRFYCDGEGCQSTAYSYSDYHRIAIEFADRTRESNVFTKSAFRAGYRVAVRGDSLVVEEDPSLGLGMFSCASASLPVLAVGLLLLGGRGGSGRKQ